MTTHPVIIQAGMGIGVSHWQLAKVVAENGHMGVVSGTAIDSVLIRRLQSGDKEGHVRRALDHFPLPEISSRILKKYFKYEGLKAEEPFSLLPLMTVPLSQERQEIIILANFVEVFLAKEGHQGKVGINFLEKVQLPVLPSLFGAMLANVDYVLMGAGIPKEIPGILDQLSEMKAVKYNLSVAHSASENFTLHFSPLDFTKGKIFDLKRPDFLAIISSSTLAMTLAKKSTGQVNGFVVEDASAGGHNAPPRGQLKLSEKGEPIYGPRDLVDLKAIKELGLPFWLAGSQGSAEALKTAREKGAQGIQVGTAFALCEESGLDPLIKESLIKLARKSKAYVFTDPLASPTGFPFKVALITNTLSESEVYKKRKRVCDLGYLRETYKKDDGSLGYRCPAEPIESYVAKGGKVEDTVNRKCLCNGLMANINLGQKHKDLSIEKPLVTIGDDVVHVPQFIPAGKKSYSAKDVLYKLTTPHAVATI